MSNGQKGLVVPLSFTPSVGTYLQRLQALGAIEGSGMSLTFSPHIHPVLEALHHVLAGGEVEVRITRAGQADIVEELNALAEQVLEESRALPPSLVVTAV
ncbi:hypothetical protein POL68_26535 [Stigmatella sp. ncwal1]|uniref:Uncharacterized protein n=1 Tax=Stigmatella ashevillensis TaxID=2995309 RepID=A0ABT5DEQ0_9BACT|nr:hypothetical protein [Stigmatella ashevillena]MDC0712054.1 hypothetical protein [Stigmatella ashevillena]